MPRADVTLSLIERGWQAARERAGRLTADGGRVVHVTKGRLGRGVRHLITLRRGERLLEVPHRLFWPAVWGVSLGLRLADRLDGVLVDNDRARRRVGRWPQTRGRVVGLATGEDDAARADLR